MDADVIIKEVYTKPEFIQKIAQSFSNMDERKVSDIMRYNVLTVRQVTSVTGLSVNDIWCLIRKKKLVRCAPFRSHDSKPESVFVLRDKTLEEFIEEELDA